MPKQTNYAWKEYKATITLPDCKLKKRHYHKRTWVPDWLFNIFARTCFQETLDHKYNQEIEALKKLVP